MYVLPPQNQVHDYLELSTQRWLFLPESRFLYVWDCLQAVALVYVAVVYPFNEAFSVQTSVGSTLFWVDVFMDVWFILDICVVRHAALESTIKYIDKGAQPRTRGRGDTTVLYIIRQSVRITR